ncbi:hypothetical protein HOY82DRAFT_597052 [Tuber indicum]|nr:hypothetical protein HOY82DRAFT_597052 [Tuber indicum]
MSDEPTPDETFEKELNDLRRKYIALKMNSRVREQEINQLQMKAERALDEHVSLVHRVDQTKWENQILRRRLESAQQERDKLENKLIDCQRDNMWLKQKVKEDNAEIASAQERINYLAQAIADLTDTTVMDEQVGQEGEGEKGEKGEKEAKEVKEVKEAKEAKEVKEVNEEEDGEDEEEEWWMKKEEWELRQEELEREQKEKEDAGGDGVW